MPVVQTIAMRRENVFAASVCLIHGAVIRGRPHEWGVSVFQHIWFGDFKANRDEAYNRETGYRREGDARALFQSYADAMYPALAYLMTESMVKPDLSKQAWSAQHMGAIVGGYAMREKRILTGKIAVANMGIDTAHAYGGPNPLGL